MTLPLGSVSSHLKTRQGVALPAPGKLDLSGLSTQHTAPRSNLQLHIGPMSMKWTTPWRGGSWLLCPALGTALSTADPGKASTQEDCPAQLPFSWKPNPPPQPQGSLEDLLTPRLYRTVKLGVWERGDGGVIMWGPFHLGGVLLVCRDGASPLSTSEARLLQPLPLRRTGREAAAALELSQAT